MLGDIVALVCERRGTLPPDPRERMADALERIAAAQERLTAGARPKPKKAPRTATRVSDTDRAYALKIAREMGFYVRGAE